MSFNVKGGPTVHQRFDSYYNYCKLFNYILSADTPVNLELPNQWLWEIIDEFIYQFQARVATKILLEFGGTLCKSLIYVGQVPVSIVHYTRLGSSIKRPTPN